MQRIEPRGAGAKNVAPSANDEINVDAVGADSVVRQQKIGVNSHASIDVGQEVRARIQDDLSFPFVAIPDSRPLTSRRRACPEDKRIDCAGSGMAASSGYRQGDSHDRKTLPRPKHFLKNMSFSTFSCIDDGSRCKLRLDIAIRLAAGFRAQLIALDADGG
jgi:hypothetical protein